MFTKILKWTAIAALIGGLFWHRFENYGTLLQFVVSAAAIAVVAQAVAMRRYVWMILFLLVACLFNPVLPLGLSNYSFMLLSVFAVLLFFVSLQLLYTQPRLSVASITDRMPGNESL